ncbi:hypothetical protein QBC38DRAFT_373524 [Podospora fimiseda]|uniref:Uncharacterized protein n=1 Tax=Podospora fimiseda TaxID=252190 RepID=A0AAN7BHA0_9PEZI|nr:hypothetical protein QBC38DRAFT_373524 [Podospora fimiseda]
MTAQPPQTIIPPPKYVSSPSAWRSKLVMRAWAILCCIIIAGVGGSIAALDGVEGDFMLFLGPSIAVPFIWSVAEAICIWKRPGNRGIHPGAVVGVDLIIWLGLGFVHLVMLATGLWFRPERLIEGYYYHNGVYRGYHDRDDFDKEELAKIDELSDKIQGRGRATLTFLAFLALTHFVLFVVACCETHKRNRMPKMVYVVQQPMYAPEGNGQQQYPLAQYPQQQYYAPQQQYYAPQQPIPMQSAVASPVSGANPVVQAPTGPARYA